MVGTVGGASRGPTVPSSKQAGQAACKQGPVQLQETLYPSGRADKLVASNGMGSVLAYARKACAA